MPEEAATNPDVKALSEPVRKRMLRPFTRALHPQARSSSLNLETPSRRFYG
jgi:hypothetical protein